MDLGVAIVVLECFKLGNYDSISHFSFSVLQVGVPVLRPLIRSLEAPLNSEKAG